MPCAECAQLLARFARQSDAYYEAVRALASRIVFMEVDEYYVLKAAMDKARLDSVLAHLELAQHKQQHALALRL
jgi:hypothetical protein